MTKVKINGGGGGGGTGGGDISGSGIANELAYFTAEKTIDNLPVNTYPNLSELSYVKGVTSAIQTQINGKVTANGAITGATKTKITYDAKGLVTAGADMDGTEIVLTDVTTNNASVSKHGFLPKLSGSSTDVLKGDGTRGAGGGGVTDYNDLTDKPIININNPNLDTLLTPGVYRITGTPTSSDTIWAVFAVFIGVTYGGFLNVVDDGGGSIVQFLTFGIISIYSRTYSASTRGTMSLLSVLGSDSSNPGYYVNNPFYINGTSTGKTQLATANTSETDYVATLPAKTGTIAMASDIPSKATGAEVDTGTDDTKYVTAKAMKDSGYLSSMSDVTAASDTVAGKVELATSAETTTGTDATRAITPDGFAGSDYGKRFIQIPLGGVGDAVTTGDGKAYWICPTELNGRDVVGVYAYLGTVSSSGTPTYQLRNATDSVDILSTRVTIDANEYTSFTAATAAVINSSNKSLATGDRIYVDKDVAGTGEKGDVFVMVVRLP